MLPKRIYAFRENCRSLAERGGRLYLWTFTLPVRMEPKLAAKKWQSLQRRMKRWVPGWEGLRVYEKHPGRKFLGLDGASYDDSHGLHVHVLCTRFLYIRDVLRACRAEGWGRTDVRRIRGDRARIGNYLAKYLAKERPPELKGLRLVGYIGKWDRIRIKQVETVGFYKDVWDAAKESPCWGSLNFFGKLELVRALLVKITVEGGSPQDNVQEWIDGRALSLHRSRSWLPVSHTDLLLLRDSGVFEADDHKRNQRFIAKAKRLPIPEPHTLVHGFVPGFA